MLCEAQLLVSFDMSRAFDMVNHDILISKLQANNFPRDFLIWLQNYLKDRTARVKVGEELSLPFPLGRGVPQGSVLAPFLFCSYISSLAPSTTLSHGVKYADDFNIILRLASENKSEIEYMLNREIRHVSEWCVKKRLSLNVAKSKAMLFTRKQVNLSPQCLIPIVKEMKILGLHFTDTLEWKLHISKLCSKAYHAYQRFHILRRLKKFMTDEELHEVYTLSVRSIMEYASPVYVGLNKKLACKLQKVDNRAHRLIYNTYFGSGNKRKCQYRSNEIQARRDSASKRLFHSIRNSSNHLLNHRITRKMRSQYLVPYSRTIMKKNTFFPYVTALLNDELRGIVACN